METTYTASHRRYYEKNKEKINASPCGRANVKHYYDKHKDEINAKRRLDRLTIGARRGRPRKIAETPVKNE